MACACEHFNATDRGVPIPAEGSFSYAVTDKGVGELTSLIREHAVSRGSGTAPRVQRVADGEEALEKAMRGALPFAQLTNDFMHASGHMNACCEKLGIPDAAREYRTCRAVMLRHGAGSAVDRTRRLCPRELEAPKEARDALGYLDRRRDNMRCGWLRRNGYYISSCHVEAAARILVEESLGTDPTAIHRDRTHRQRSCARAQDPWGEAPNAPCEPWRQALQVAYLVIAPSWLGKFHPWGQAPPRDRPIQHSHTPSLRLLSCHTFRVSWRQRLARAGSGWLLPSASRLSEYRRSPLRRH